MYDDFAAPGRLVSMSCAKRKPASRVTLGARLKPTESSVASGATLLVVPVPVLIWPPEPIESERVAAEATPAESDAARVMPRAREMRFIEISPCNGALRLRRTSGSFGRRLRRRPYGRTRATPLPTRRRGEFRGVGAETPSAAGNGVAGATHHAA